MIFRRLFLIFTFLLFGSTFSVSYAAEIDGLTASLSSNGKSLYVSWASVSNEIITQSDGYALQWSHLQSDVHIDKVGRKFLSFQQSSIYLRAGDFEAEKDYFFRVYTYKKEGSSFSRAILGNGSKILKLEVNNDGTLGLENIEPNDPVITNNTNSSDSPENNVLLEEFGHLRAEAYDSFIDFYWSRPKKLINSDFDGFHVVLSQNNDLSSPDGILEVDRDNFKGRIKGLKPETRYYAQGFFYKIRAGESQRFGESGTPKLIKTITSVNRNIGPNATRKQRKMARNIVKLERKPFIFVVAGGSDTPSSSTGSAESNTNTSSSSSGTSVSSNSSSNSTNISANNSTEAEKKISSERGIKSKISEIQKRIAQLKKELSAWQKKLRQSKTSAKTNRSRKAQRIKTKTKTKKNYVKNYQTYIKNSAPAKARGYRGRRMR